MSEFLNTEDIDTVDDQAVLDDPVVDFMLFHRGRTLEILATSATLAIINILMITFTKLTPAMITLILAGNYGFIKAHIEQISQRTQNEPNVKKKMAEWLKNNSNFDRQAVREALGSSLYSKLEDIEIEMTYGKDNNAV